MVCNDNKIAERFTIRIYTKRDLIELLVAREEVENPHGTDG